MNRTAKSTVLPQDQMDVAFVQAGARVQDFVSLLKPRVMSLVVFSGFAGLAVAPGHLHPLIAVVAVLCIAVGAGASGAINMWFDRDIDAVMNRTCGRPIPRGYIAPEAALSFGLVLAVFSVLLMGIAVNWTAAALLGFTIIFYVFIYTMWLKRRTAQNIVIGGAAGAFPPVIGWAAVTGGLDALPVLLFAIVFFWTPPHFWALSLWAHADYARAGVPMLPVVAGAKRTRREIFGYTIVLVGISLLPWAMGLVGAVYGCAAAALGLGFLVCAWRVLRDQQNEVGISLTNDAPARAAFKFSIAYLFILFAALAVDRLLPAAPLFG